MISAASADLAAALRPERGDFGALAARQALEPKCNTRRTLGSGFELRLPLAAMVEAVSDPELFETMDRENRSRKALSVSLERLSAAIEAQPNRP